MAEHKTTTGLSREIVAALSYLLGPLSGFMVLILEKNDFIRFHAMQSIVVLGSLIVLHWVLAATVVLSMLIPLVSLVTFAVWIFLIFKASQGERYALPIVGEYVQKLLK